MVRRPGRSRPRQEAVRRFLGEDREHMRLPPDRIFAVLVPGRFNPRPIGHAERGAVEVDMGGFEARDRDDPHMRVVLRELAYLEEFPLGTEGVAEVHELRGVEAVDRFEDIGRDARRLVDDREQMLGMAARLSNTSPPCACGRAWLGQVLLHRYRVLRSSRCRK